MSVRDMSFHAKSVFSLNSTQGAGDFWWNPTFVFDVPHQVAFGAVHLKLSELQHMK